MAMMTSHGAEPTVIKRPSVLMWALSLLEMRTVAIFLLAAPDHSLCIYTSLSPCFRGNHAHRLQEVSNKKENTDKQSIDTWDDYFKQWICLDLHRSMQQRGPHTLPDLPSCEKPQIRFETQKFSPHPPLENNKTPPWFTVPVYPIPYCLSRELIVNQIHKQPQCYLILSLILSPERWTVHQWTMTSFFA